MNNDAFRKLVASTPARQDDGATSSKPAPLGTKKSAFVAMTPRPGKAPSSDDFARQVREQHSKMRPPKKYKSSAPKGSKFGAGYVDRAKARQEAQDNGDDKEERIKALEEQAKLGQIPWETFEALRDKITGGDVSSTHLVKGLDRQLLERVRRGEDVLGTGKKSEDGSPPVDVDDELEKLGEREVGPVQKEQTKKRGVKAVEPVAGKKRTRDQLLAELKAQRKAAAEAKAANAPKLDGRWKKIGEQSRPKVELDHKGREVVTIVQEDGTVKKMVKKAAPATTDSKAAVDMPDISKPVLGADVAVPEQKETKVDEESDDDIFAGAGTEYNPLGDVDDDDDDDEDDSSSDEAKPARRSTASTVAPVDARDEKDTRDGTPPKPAGDQPIKAARNYFGESARQTEDEAEQDRFKGIENVLKKAANLGAEKAASDEDEEADSLTREGREARKAKRAKMLAQSDRDLEDMDMGFGGSRGEDEEDGMDVEVKLAEWKGGKAGGDDGWEEDDGKRGDKKKRKPKKRKGDVNNAADIFRVIEGRKAKDNK
ncbi:Putative RED-like protein [Septoria linicola]|uniref:RED-like protein n=1 Tax=Septoria linicola TaxID=215465 RepID=A0A9Q9B3D3_9PEZI|nr:Putative RED-like protein [Septoria linicola]